MKYIIILICFAATTIFAQNDCSVSRLDKVKDNNVDISDFAHTYAYGNYNKTYNSYRAIFINYDRAADSDFKEMTGNEIKVVVMIFTSDQSKLVPGIYTFQPEGSGDPKTIAVGIYTAKGTSFAASYNNESIGKVDIYTLDETSLCGTIEIKDSKEMIVSGKFNVMNEPVN